MARLFNEAVIMSAKGATGAGQPVSCKDYRFCLVSVATDGGGDADFTIKFQGAISDGATKHQTPAFGSAQTVTNMWDYVECIDREDGGVIDGDTGITVSSADDYRLFQINIDGLKYFNAVLTAYSEGEITVKGTFFE